MTPATLSLSSDLFSESLPLLPLFPLARTYIVFSLDPIATLASLNDAEVLVVASTLPSRQYVGYVAEVEVSSRLQSVLGVGLINS